MTQTNANKVNQLVYAGLREVFGPRELTRMAESSGTGENRGNLQNSEVIWRGLPDAELDSVQAAMAKKYGVKELQGLLVRCGRASCKFFVKEFGADMQVTSIEYRLLPSRKRLSTGLKAAAGMWSQLFKKDISVSEEGETWVWREAKTRKNGVSDTGQDCYFTIGLLQEYLAWLSGGKAFSVRMAEAGDPAHSGACLCINKRPIE